MESTQENTNVHEDEPVPGDKVQNAGDIDEKSAPGPKRKRYLEVMKSLDASDQSDEEYTPHAKLIPQLKKKKTSAARDENPPSQTKPSKKSGRMATEPEMAAAVGKANNGSELSRKDGIEEGGESKKLEQKPFCETFTSRDPGGARDFTEKLRGSYAGVADGLYDLEFSDFQNMCESEGYRECFTAKIQQKFDAWENESAVNQARVKEWRRILWRAGYQMKGYPRPPMIQNIDTWITRKPFPTRDQPVHLRCVDFFNDLEDPEYNTGEHNKKLSQKQKMVSMPVSKAAFKPMIKARSVASSVLQGAMKEKDCGHKYTINDIGSYSLAKSKADKAKEKAQVKSAAVKKAPKPGKIAKRRRLTSEEATAKREAFQKFVSENTFKKVAEPEKTGGDDAKPAGGLAKGEQEPQDSKAAMSTPGNSRNDGDDTSEPGPVNDPNLFESGGA